MGLVTIFAQLQLIGLFALGLLGTWKLFYDNGGLSLLQASVAVKSPLLSDSDIPLREHWTGYADLDRQLNFVVNFFGPIALGRLPQLTLIGFHFFGQLVTVWFLILIEGFRVGNAWKLISFVTTFGLLIENVAMALILPAWCVMHLITSPAVGGRDITPAQRQTGLLVHPMELKVLPWSVLIGLGIPLAMIFATKPVADGPIVMSTYFWIIARQLHPLFTAVAHLVLSILSPSSRANYATASDRNKGVAKALRPVYNIAIYIAVITHVLSMAVSFGPKLLPYMFSDQYRDLLDPITVWQPPAFWESPVPQAPSISKGALIFVQWDELVSCAAVLVWAFAVNRDQLSTHPQGSSLLVCLFKIGAMTLIGGPAAAAVYLIRERDETLLEPINEATTEKKTS